MILMTFMHVNQKKKKSFGQIEFFKIVPLFLFSLRLNVALISLLFIHFGSQSRKSQK